MSPVQPVSRAITSTASQESDKPSSHSHLSGDTIAGIVIGSVIGGTLILGAGCWVLPLELCGRACKMTGGHLVVDERDERFL